MAPYFYQTNHSHEERPLFDTEIPTYNSENRKIIYITSGIALTVIALAALGHCTTQNHTSPQTDFHSKSFVKTPPACSTIECFATNCDKQLAPFLCTSGNAKFGCSDRASTWVDDKICTTSCDLRDCDLNAMVEDEASLPRHCDDCTKEQCDFLAKEFFQSCGDAAPFVCLNGSSRFGCSESPFMWAAAVNTTCSECCNKLSCNK